MSEIQHDQAVTLPQVSDQVAGTNVTIPRVHVRFAKGTRNLTQVARQVARESLRDQLERTLRKEALNTQQLAKVTGAKSDMVQSAVDRLIREGKIFNLSSSQYPIWTWKVGDKGSSQELTTLIRRLISERPMSTRQLVDATGARLSRVGGVLVDIGRKEPPDRFLNMGQPRQGRWFLIPDTARPGTFAQKGQSMRPRTGTGSDT